MEYLTISGNAEAEFEIQRSVFICNVKGVSDFEEGMSFVKEISKKYSDATHNCYAVLTRDGRQKFSDDGEPQGTAGVPILQVLKKSELTDVAAVVTRYFGGIKLGAGGLVTSYSKSVSDALAVAEKATMKLCDEIVVTAGYSDFNKITDIAASFGKTRAEYSDEVILTVYVPTEKTAALTEKLLEATAGKIRYTKTTQSYIKF